MRRPAVFRALALDVLVNTAGGGAVPALPLVATTPAAAGAALVVLGVVWASSGVQLNLLAFDAEP